MTELLDTAALSTLIELLQDDGYRVIAPTIRDEAIVYDEVRSIEDLPIGWTDKQGPGQYRLERRNDQSAFGYVVGPHSWKQFLAPPREQLLRSRLCDGKPEWTSTIDDGPGLAFIGVRGCELAAIGIQDTVFTKGPFVDGRYRRRRDRCFIVAVDCTEAGDLCFCTSMGTGPRAEGDYDLRLTELGSELLVETGTSRGRAVADRLPTRPAKVALTTEAGAAIAQCGASMGRSLDVTDLPAKLMGNLDHPRWKDVAERCLACGNCTLVCPTCFCFTINDKSDLTATVTSRERSWDSCFTADHSTIHGAQFRSDVKSRYQQWMTHKLATWTSQFGTSGCVGCGRCIAWCPVGIDLTEEAATIAAGDGIPVVLPAARRYQSSRDDGQLPKAARVSGVARETHDTVTLSVELPPDYVHQHGQFNMLSLPGIGDVPISISGSGTESLEHTLRAVGKVTAMLSDLPAGSYLGLRGPFGTAWPLADAVGRQVVVVAGGIGLAPLRSVLREMLRRTDDFPRLRLLYGTRTPRDILFNRELLGWVQSSRIRAHVTVDRGDDSWTGNIGVVTKLIRRKRLPKDGLYFLCGPEIMMSLALAELFAVEVPAENIYLSMERNMKCAVGLCGRCQYGPHFVCKDGPIFRYDRIANIFGKPGF